MPSPLVLVITSEQDTHVHVVGELLSERGIDWVRLNTDDLFRNTRMTLHPTTATGQITILDSGLTVDLEAVSAVWYRKPETPSTSHMRASGGHSERFLEAEAYEALLGLYAMLQDKPWINNPLTTRYAHRRFRQLHVARRIGFLTARSVFANDPDEVLAFAESVDGPLALKSLGALAVTDPVEGNVAHQYGVLTRTIDRDTLGELRASIENMPTFLQEYVDKRYDLRVVVAGRHVFACRIHSQSGELTRHDFRIQTKNLHHETIELEPELRALMGRYLDEMGLNFGCFDFVEDADGTPYFLECNPNGQWLWVEKKTGAPIAAAIADLLADLAGAA